MLNDNPAIYFRVWGIDDIAYGPVELPVLVNWIRDGRVFADSWIYREDKKEWTRAADLTELKLLFRARGGEAGAGAGQVVAPGTLRRMRLFAEMEERHPASFLNYMEVVEFLPNADIVRAGDPGDAMFLVLEGEVRSRVLSGTQESTLATLGVGECFGEIAVMDGGVRSTDVVANQETRLLRISSVGLKRLFAEAPALAAPFFLSLNRIVVGRIRRLTKEYQTALQFGRTAGQAASSRG